MAEKLTLKTLLADYPVTRALRRGTVSSPLFDFDFAPYEVSNHAFKPMVRDLAFDAGELALFTYLQARAYGKPLVLLPAVISGRFQHHCIAYNTANGELRPGDLSGKRVGVRAYTQTTGAWVRGILANEYGVDLDSVTWVTFEDAHVAEYVEPPNVVRAPPGKKLSRMLLDGELDAAMLGSDMPDDPRLKTVIPEPEKAAVEWYERRGAVPVNHMFVVTEALSRSRPDVVRELYRVLKESKEANGPPKGIDTRPYGVEANRKGLELAIEYAMQQKLLPRRLSVEELFDDVTGSL